jgi:hypothetical protein
MENISKRAYLKGDIQIKQPQLTSTTFVLMISSRLGARLGNHALAYKETELHITDPRFCNHESPRQSPTIPIRTSSKISIFVAMLQMEEEKNMIFQKVDSITRADQ